MKKIILLLFIPIIGFSQSKDMKKAIKRLGSVEITNRGLDLEAKFVPFSLRHNPYIYEVLDKNWDQAFFKAGLKTGRWENKNNENVIYGRYVVEIGSTSAKNVIIKDVENDFSTVAIIEWSGKLSPLGYRHLVNELIKSN